MSNQPTRDEVRRRYIEHERRYRSVEECDAAATFDRDIWPPGATGATLDRASVHDWLMRSGRMSENGIREFEEAFPPPTPPLPKCAWGHQTGMAHCSEGYYVTCIDCGCSCGPFRPTETAAIEAWEYPQKLAAAEGRVEAAKAAWAQHPSAEMGRQERAARKELSRLQENKP